MAVSSDAQVTMISPSPISEPGGLVDQWLRTLGEKAVALGRTRAPVRSGKLASSLTYEVSSGVLTVKATAPYAAYVSGGTSAHLITPRNVQVLRFSAGGGIVFTALVEHPGTVANPWLENLMKEVVSNA